MCPLKHTNTAHDLIEGEGNHEKVAVNLTLRFLFPKMKFFEEKKRWSDLETVRILESTANTRQPRGANTTRNFSLRNSRATGPLAHQPPHHHIPVASLLTH